MCTEEICIAKDLINVDYVGHDLLSDKSPQIIDSFSSRQERLDYAINLLKKYNTPQSRYYLCEAYHNSRVSHRKESIEIFLNYLTNELYQERFIKIDPIYISLYKMSNFDAMNFHIATILSWLGEAYEGEYDYQNALLAFQKAYTLAPYYSWAPGQVSRIYMKMNIIDKSIEVLEKYKDTKWYEPYDEKSYSDNVYHHDDNKILVDEWIDDYKKKIERGYVFKPRKRKIQKK